MKRHAAFDVSSKVARGRIVDEVVRIVREGQVAAEPGATAAWLGEHAPGLALVGIETGPSALWRSHGLRQIGVPVACLEAAYVLISRPGRPRAPKF